MTKRRLTFRWACLRPSRHGRRGSSHQRCCRRMVRSGSIHATNTRSYRTGKTAAERGGREHEPLHAQIDKLRSYGVAQRQLLPGVEHRHSRYQIIGPELASANPTTRAADARFKSSRQAQDFLCAHSFIYGHSIPADTNWQAVSIARSDRTPSMSGTRKRASDKQHNRRRTTALRSTLPALG